MSDAACPAISELFADPPVAAVSAHASACLRCRALLADSATRFPVDDRDEAAGPLQAGDVAIGDVSLIVGPETDELVPSLIVSSHEDGLIVVPVSERTELAAEWDVLLGRELLGYEAMAEVWNYGTVLHEQAGTPVATCQRDQLDAVGATVRAALGGDAVPDGVPTGPPMLDVADPRALFQEAETERLRTFWEPTLVLAGAMTLGQLVHHRREELELAPSDLKDVGPAGRWIRELERDALDIPAALTPSALSQLMKRLRISASRRLGRIATVTLESRSPSLARSGQAQPEPHRVASYVSDFLDELEREQG